MPINYQMIKIFLELFQILCKFIISNKLRWNDGLNLNKDRSKYDISNVLDLVVL